MLITHKIWEMTGYFMEVSGEENKERGIGRSVGAGSEEMKTAIPLPSAFKQFDDPRT